MKYHEELNVFDEIVVANHSTILLKACPNISICYIMYVDST
jgi:hypothetical protein